MTADNVDDMHLTRAEQDKLANQLHELADWIAAELADTVTRQTSRTTGPRIRSSRDEPLPFNETASQIAWDLDNTLRAWIDETATARHYQHPGRLDTAAAARWLAEHIIALALTDRARIAYDELLHAISRARRAIDKPPRPDYVGRCDNCRADLWALPDDDTIVCRGCGDIASRAYIDARIDAELRQRLFTARELVNIVADRLGQTIKPKTVHNLARHTISVRGHNRRGEHLYKCGDVLDALTRRPRNHARDGKQHTTQ